MDINELIDAAARAAVEGEAVPASNIRLRAATHEARKALADQGISDDRMAAAISLAKLETRADAGTVTRAVQNEINILKEFLHD